jgi:acyl carrier protein
MLENISTRCLSVISKFITDPVGLEKIKQGESLLETGSLDSLSMVNLVVELENEFGMSLESDELETLFSSLQNLASHIHTKTVSK